MNLVRRPVGASVALGAAALWLVLALDRPTSTFHFAPIIVAAAWPVLARIRTDQPLDPQGAVGRAVVGLVLALTVTAVLHAADALRGPSLWDDDSGGLEAVIFAVGGATAGLVFSVVRRS